MCKITHFLKLEYVHNNLNQNSYKSVSRDFHKPISTSFCKNSEQYDMAKFQSFRSGNNKEGTYDCYKEDHDPTSSHMLDNSFAHAWVWSSNIII